MYHALQSYSQASNDTRVLTLGSQEKDAQKRHTTEMRMLKINGLEAIPRRTTSRMKTYMARNRHQTKTATFFRQKRLRSLYSRCKEGGEDTTMEMIITQVRGKRRRVDLTRFNNIAIK